MLFRPVRSGLAEAMAEVKEVNNWMDLVGVLDSYDSAVLAEPNGCIELESQGWDERIGWDSHLVLVNGSPAGYTNGGTFDE